MSVLRRVLTHPRVEPRIAAVLRRRIVDRPWRFVLRELGGRRTAAIYRVRENGMRTRVVHNTGDVSALDQSFYSHAHEPPPGALHRLQALGRPLRALDVGANVGMWGLWLHSRLPVERIVGIEASAVNVARHRHQIDINDLGGRWSVMHRAATTAPGPVSFLAREGSTGSIVEGLTPGADTVEGIDLFSLVEDVDLLKIDIEGGEWPILADSRFKELPVPVVMVEYHADGAPSDEPQLAAQRALEDAGYLAEATEQFRPGFGTVWGHRR
jgi:FkbM family methyltransferase